MRKGFVRPSEQEAGTRMRTPHGNRLDHSTSQLRSGTRIGKWSQNRLNMDTESRETVPTFRRSIHRRLQTSGRVSDLDDPPKAGQRSRQCLRQEPKSQILKKKHHNTCSKGYKCKCFKHSEYSDQQVNDSKQASPYNSNAGWTSTVLRLSQVSPAYCETPSTA